MPVEIAIVGSGPAGFYTAESLLESGREVRIDMIERLPTPYGLIRGGVAPDHQSTKKVMRRYEETALDPRVAYFGNVEMGRDVTLAELRERYDAVVLAVGAPLDRPAGLPGEDKANVFGSAAFVGWYNGHPDFRDLAPDLNVAAAVVIGAGNVAIDVARLLMRTPEAMAETDIADDARKAIESSPVRDVYMVARRGPLEAKFTNVELRELGELAGCDPIVDASQFPADAGALPERERRLAERNLKTLQEFAARAPDPGHRRLHILFNLQPVEIVGGAGAEGVRFERTHVVDGRARGTGEIATIDCGLVVTCIGYRGTAIDGVPFDPGKGIVPSADGRVEKGLYVVGWIKRGPTGVIGSSRPDAKAACAQIDDDFPDGGGGKPGRNGLAGLLKMRGVRVVGFDDWKRIEATEERNAVAPAPRRKFTAVADMLAVLDRPCGGSGR